MIIVSPSTFTLGRFTVHVRPRFDSPGWAVYIVYLGERLIGKQFSRPNISDCQWLARQGDPVSRPVYAPRSLYGRKYSTGGYNTKNATKPETEPA